MTTTPPETPPPAGDSTDQGPRVTRDEARDLGRLRRSATDRHVAGVAGGLARHFDIDPVIIRVAFVVLGLMGPGIFLYGALWLLVPEDGEEKAPIRTDESLRTVLIVVAGVLTLLGLAGNSWDPFWFPWQLILVGLVAWWLLRRREKDQLAASQPYAAPYGPTAPSGQPPQYAQYSPQTAQGWVGQTPPGTPAGFPPAPPQGWVGTPPRPPGPPRDPRKRGPRLFGFTLALIAVSLGAVGMADMAGVDVADSAYPALALGIVAVMLLIGAFWGRAGGLILLGIVSTLALAGSTVTEHWDGGEETHTPRTAENVDDEYWLDTGELTVDLTDVKDLEALQGRKLDIGVGMGQVRIFVPRGLDVDVDAEVGGPGNVQLFGDNRGGIHVEDDAHHDGGDDVPELEIDAFVGIGEIKVMAR